MKLSHRVFALCAAAMATLLAGCGKPDQPTSKPPGVHPGIHLAVQAHPFAQSG